jgi:hypothetical protein
MSGFQSAPFTSANLMTFLGQTTPFYSTNTELLALVGHGVPFSSTDLPGKSLMSASATGAGWEPVYDEDGKTITGYSAEADVTVSGGTSPYTYLWYSGGTSLGQTSSSYSGSTGSPFSYEVYCIVTDAHGATALSNPVDFS